MTENPWILCENELPPCDGLYTIPYGDHLAISVYYDGFHFSREGRIYFPEKWCKVGIEKLYGKQK